MKLSIRFSKIAGINRGKYTYIVIKGCRCLAWIYLAESKPDRTLKTDRRMY